VRVGDSRDEDERRREEGETGEEASSRHSDLVLSAQKNRSEYVNLIPRPISGARSLMNDVWIR
jgi:hypothetical protein